MKWMMLWAYNYVAYQIPFENEALCEAAKTELTQHHDVPADHIACVQVAE